MMPSWRTTATATTTTTTATTTALHHTTSSRLQLQLQLHLQLQLQLHCTTLHPAVVVRWPLQPLQPLQKTQLQPAFGPSVDSPCHPWVTTTNLSYRFLIFETSATALCGTTGTHAWKHAKTKNVYIYITYMYIYNYIYITYVYIYNIYVYKYIYIHRWYI